MITAGRSNRQVARNIIGRSGMGFDERIVGSSELSLSAGSGIPVNDVFLSGTVDHSLGLFYCHRFLIDRIGIDKLPYSRLHPRFVSPISSIALGCLPYGFLCV